MSAYAIFDADIHDQDMMAEYLKEVPATLKEHGAKLLAATSTIDTVEGGWESKRIVILEFADMDAARAWYDSPEYQAVLPLRLGAANDRVIFVDGV
jgi:uncharacterized protein (DUF1330 family)